MIVKNEGFGKKAKNMWGLRGRRWRRRGGLSEEGTFEQKLEFSERTDHMDVRVRVWQAGGTVSTAALGQDRGSKKGRSRSQAAGSRWQLGGAGPRSAQQCFSIFFITAPS